MSYNCIEQILNNFNRLIMSRKQLVKDIADTTGVSQTQANNFISAFVESVQKNVANDEPVTIVGFGTFYKTYRKETTGRNPKTGEPIKIQAANQPKFRAGKTFKEVVNS